MRTPRRVRPVAYSTDLLAGGRFARGLGPVPSGASASRFRRTLPTMSNPETDTTSAPRVRAFPLGETETNAYLVSGASGDPH